MSGVGIRSAVPLQPPRPTTDDSEPGRAPSAAQARQDADSISQEIDARIKALGNWRGEVLARIQNLIKQADPEVVEEVKWRKPSNSLSEVPTSSHSGIICTGEIYKDKVEMTFAKGAALDDPSGFFNSSHGGNTRRVIDGWIR